MIHYYKFTCCTCLGLARGSVLTERGDPNKLEEDPTLDPCILVLPLLPLTLTRRPFLARSNDTLG